MHKIIWLKCVAVFEIRTSPKGFGQENFILG